MRDETGQRSGGSGRMIIEGKTITVFSGGAPGAPVLYLHTVSEEGREVFGAVREITPAEFTLVEISGLDWDRDMAPWDAPPAFRKGEPFTGGADAYLRTLTERILPEVEGQFSVPPLWRGIAGYSLAGLFALYSLWKTDVFSRAASVSGSLWYPGFREFVRGQEPRRHPDRVYFSLGDRESRTRNPVLQSVLPGTEEICALFRERGADTIFETNHGNHYDHPAERTAKGIAWLLNRDETAGQA